MGAGRFGILAVDSSKRRFAVMLTDFLGNVLLDMAVVENTGPALQAFVERLKREYRSRKLKGLVAGVERTGRYHVPMAQALKPYGQVEMVDPYATKPLREPAHPGRKTDREDLLAIVRAIEVGFGTTEADLPAAPLEWRLAQKPRPQGPPQHGRAGPPVGPHRVAPRPRSHGPPRAPLPRPRSRAIPRCGHSRQRDPSGGLSGREPLRPAPERTGHPRRQLRELRGRARPHRT